MGPPSPSGRTAPRAARASPSAQSHAGTRGTSGYGGSVLRTCPPVRRLVLARSWASRGSTAGTFPDASRRDRLVAGACPRGRGIRTLKRATCTLVRDQLGGEQPTSAAYQDNAASLPVSRKVGYVDNGFERRQRREGELAVLRRLVLTRRLRPRGPDPLQVKGVEGPGARSASTVKDGANQTRPQRGPRAGRVHTAPGACRKPNLYWDASSRAAAASRISPTAAPTAATRSHRRPRPSGCIVFPRSSPSTTRCCSPKKFR